MLLKLLSPPSSARVLAKSRPPAPPGPTVIAYGLPGVIGDVPLLKAPAPPPPPAE